MCGIAGGFFYRSTGQHQVLEVGVMIDQLRHRGPDGNSVTTSGHAVLGSARLAIVDVAHGRQPFRNEMSDIQVVFNGEIYNHRTLREGLYSRGHRFSSWSDGEVIAHLYEEHGADCFGFLDGQFAIALSDTRRGVLYLARDRMGICPLHWAESSEGLYFCSEVKGLRSIGLASGPMNPEAILQLAYFGTICAPLTPFTGVSQLPSAHYLKVDRSGPPRLQRYWSLQFPRNGEYPSIDERSAREELHHRLEQAVYTHSQGEFSATCFLSGGIDSAVIGALLQRNRRSESYIKAFCASSDLRKIDEGEAAQETANYLKLDLIGVKIDEPAIAGAFERLVWHAETPVISTEATALMLLAEHVKRHSKIVLTGEGADEAFGGYLAFKQFKFLGAMTAPAMNPLRGLVRTALSYQYGTDCLLPQNRRIDEVKDQFGFFPAQAYEWEFYRDALTPILSPDYRAMSDQGAQWTSFTYDRSNSERRHWLNQSLDVAYNIMLPNYLLGPHGDRVFAANSVEGRYPFLDRQVVEFAATLPPGLKIKGLSEKYILRRMAEQLLPSHIAGRPKKRFTMPFGTPFLGARAPALYTHLLSNESLKGFGYFDPKRVREVFKRLAQPPTSGGKSRVYLDRLALGLAATFVVSTQLWHYLFVCNSVEKTVRVPDLLHGSLAGTNG